MLTLIAIKLEETQEALTQSRHGSLTSKTPLEKFPITLQTQRIAFSPTSTTYISLVEPAHLMHTP